jgi:predicted deacylase
MDIMIAHGAADGPTLCLTGAIHGDEVNGVEIARQIFEETDPAHLSGTLLAIPVVNVWGFRNGSRYLADRRDLNRAFPGSPAGSLAQRIAHPLFENLVRHCDALVDLHTGSARRANLPQIRVDLTNARARDLALHFGAGIVLSGAGPEGSLRRSANEAGVPAIIYEAGGPNHFERNEIARGIEGVRKLTHFLEMSEGEPKKRGEEHVFHRTQWVRAPAGGIFLSELSPGIEIEKGDVLGTVTDPVTSEHSEVTAPHTGTLIGMARPQLVLPGFGLFHVTRDE